MDLRSSFIEILLQDLWVKTEAKFFVQWWGFQAGWIPSGLFLIPSDLYPQTGFDLSIPQPWLSSFVLYLLVSHNNLHSIGGPWFKSLPSLTGFLVIMLHVAILVACIKNVISWALQCVGLADILEPKTSSSFSLQEADCNPLAQEEIIRKCLPFTTFVQRFHGGSCRGCCVRCVFEPERRRWDVCCVLSRNHF